MIARTRAAWPGPQRSAGATTLVVVVLALLAPRGAVAQENPATPASAHAAGWVPLYDTREQIVKIDTSRFLDYERFVGVWFLLQRKRALRDLSGRDLRGSAFFEELDCGEHKSRRWEIHALDADGKTVETQTFNSAVWVRFSDNFIGQEPLLLACRKLIDMKVVPPPRPSTAR